MWQIIYYIEVKLLEYEYRAFKTYANQYNH